MPAAKYRLLYGLSVLAVSGRRLLEGSLRYDRPMTVAMPAVMRIFMQNTDALNTVFNHYCVR